MTLDDTTNSPRSDSPDAAVPAAPQFAPIRPRRGPALIVIGVVLVITIGGLALAAISTPPKPSGTPLGTIHGSTISAISAAKALDRIAVSGNPPADVATAIVLPDVSTITGVVRTPANLELFSGTINLSVADKTTNVAKFFQLELAHRGWKVLKTDATADGKGTKTFATFASGDGFYWEVEVAVEPTSSAISPELGGGNAAAGSKVSLQLVELNDQD